MEIVKWGVFLSDLSVNDFFRGNTKVKIYRDGSCSVVYCNERIFLSDEVVSINSVPVSDDDFVLLCKTNPDLQVEVKQFLNHEKAERTKEYKKALEERFGSEFVDKKDRTERKDSMKRAIDKVYDIAFQNDWSYFLTGTIAPNDDFDRNSPDEVYKKLRFWLSNCVKRFGFRYLLIPEYHPESKNGIHFHALINDVMPLEDSGRVLYKGKAWKREDLIHMGVDVSNYKTIYNLPSWRYGFSTAIPVDGNVARLACYITKYITKDSKKIFGKYYLSSRNCVRDCDVKIMNTSGFDDCLFSPIKKFGLQFKYQSDFLLDDKVERNPTEEILKYLSEREVSVFDDL